MVLWILVRNSASFEGGTLGVDHFVVPALLSVLIVMQVAMGMLVRLVKRKIVIVEDMVLGRGTVGFWSLGDVNISCFRHVGHAKGRRRTGVAVETMLGRDDRGNSTDLLELP